LLAFSDDEASALALRGDTCNLLADCVPFPWELAVLREMWSPTASPPVEPAPEPVADLLLLCRVVFPEVPFPLEDALLGLV
jgi:hypothetical protein